MNVLAVVPARGGSKGIKKKNIVDISGQPLISYTIEALKQAENVDKIVCTTDSEEIAEVAEEWGAEVPFLRPKEMAQDDSVVFNALAHAAKKTKEETGFKADYVVTMQPTNPLVKSEQIDAAISKAKKENAESVITAVKLDHLYHPYNIREKKDDGSIKFWKEEKHYDNVNRQEKPDFYHFGNTYVTNYELLVEEKKLEGDNNYMVEIDHISSLDIDKPDDIPIIEHHIERRRSEE